MKESMIEIDGEFFPNPWWDYFYTYQYVKDKYNIDFRTEREKAIEELKLAILETKEAKIIIKIIIKILDFIERILGIISKRRSQ